MSILTNENKVFGCTDFVIALVLPLKKGFPGLWTSIGELLDREGVEKGLPEMCYALEVLYHFRGDASNYSDEIINSLSIVLMENDDIFLAKELLAHIYYSMGMWPNALAYFEQIEDKDNLTLVISPDIFFFNMAWCYGKLKMYKKEEYYYKKAYEINPDAENVLNNLGYSLYKQKKYMEAKEVFQQCLEQNRDVPFALNNLARTLIALNDKKEAKELLAKHPKLSKELQERVKKFLKRSRNEKKMSKQDDTEETLPRSTDDFGIKKYQFSSERLLEEELTMRLESNENVFGLPLKIYKKRGKYGRQLITPVGRLDVLAIDNEENLYVIELKKDSGYIDAYEQTVRYIEWVRNNMVGRGKKVFGIICLNSPSQKLIEKVKLDNRLKLYEYAITYKEIK